MTFKKKSIGEVTPIIPFVGLERRALTYDKDQMLCHFTEKKGFALPLHTHEAAQTGYVIKGKIKFFTNDGELIVEPGDGYFFPSMYPHGSEALEDSEIVEFFTPCREDYIPEGGAI